uniref:Secreted protein n=1 Tax=Anopheles dirus TaxID=7168 RepID=A0A182NWB4_9DIPT
MCASVFLLYVCVCMIICGTVKNRLSGEGEQQQPKKKAKGNQIQRDSVCGRRNAR